MSSLTNRSATGAIKTKVQNVNSVYSGKNQLQGGKPIGRNGGLTAIGKASGVVRRMPPPPTLPSLRAESQGQDPDIAIVPQGGTGWSKSDTSTAVSTSTATAASAAVASESKPALISAVSASTASSGVDMRPAWAKPATAAAAPTETAPVAGFPSLASAAAAASEETKASRTWRSSGSMSEDPMHELPARFYDGGNGPARPYQPSRFQGSSDARATQPHATYGVVPSGRQTGAERWSISETREAIPEETIKKDRASPVVEPAPRNEQSHDYTKRNGGVADEQQSVQQQPQHPLKLLKRPATAAAAPQQQQPQQPRAAAATVADLTRAVEDEDEELRMTKLSKPATRVMKRCGPGQQQEGGAAAAADEMQQKPREERRQQQRKQQQTATAAPNSSQERYSEEDRSDRTSSSPPSQLTPAENIWEKRKEERASAERERVQARHGRNTEAALQQHFPSVAEAASMRVDKESTRKPTDPDFARVTLRARRGPIVNDVRALQDDGSAAAAPAPPPPPRPPRQQQQMQLQQRSHRPEEEYGSGDGYGYGGERRREYGSDSRRQYDGGQQRGGYDRRDNYRSDYGRSADYGRQEGQEYPKDEEKEKGYGRDERREERQEGGEEDEERGPTNGVRREYQPRGVRGGGQRGQRGYNGYPPVRGGRGGGGAQRSYRRDDQDDSELQQKEEGVQPVQQLQQPSDKRSWRRTSPVEGEQPEQRRGGEGGKEVDETDAAPRRRYNNNNTVYPQHPQRVTMTRGVRGGRGANARGSARGAGAASNQRRRDDQQPVDGEEGRHAAPRPTRGLYAPRAARRGGGGGEGRNTRAEAAGDDAAAVVAVDEGSNSSNLLQGGSSSCSQRDTTIRLKSPACLSSEGHEEWETASESSQTGERKSRDPPAVPAAAASRSNGTTNHSQQMQQQSKNGQQPASRPYNTTHAKREGGTKRGDRLERQAPRKESAGKKGQREDSEESVDRLAGLDLHDGRVVVVDDHPATTLLAPTDHAEFEEVLSKKQKRARAEEEKARAEAEERRKQREKERQERVMAKKEKRVQAKSERDEAQRTRQTEARKKKDEKEEKSAMKTVWNSAQPEARAALESAEAAAAAAVAATTAVTVDAATAAAADGLVLPSPIARPRAVAAAAAKKPAVELPPSESRGVQDKYEFMFDEEAARAAAAAKDATEDSDERVTLAPSETGSAITTEDQRRLTENVNLCKDLWSSGGDSTISIAAAAGVIPSVAPLLVQHHTSSVSSVHHSPAAGAGGLPTNVAKVKPQPHSLVSVSASVDASDASGASCAPRPPSVGATKQMVMGGGMHTNGMHGGHPQSIMGARSPITSSFNPGFGGYNNVFGGTSDMGLTNGGGGGGFPAGLKPGMQAVSPPNMHGLYGSRLHGMQQQQQQHRGFDQGGGLFPHPTNRSSNSLASGWSAPFEPMLAPPTSTTPPNAMSHHHGSQQQQQMSRANNMFGLFGAQPPQPPRPHGAPFAAPPPQMAQHGGHPPQGTAPSKHTMMPPLFPTNEMMNIPPPTLSSVSLLGAVGDRAARQLQQSQQQQMQHGFGGGGDRSGHHHHPQQPGGFSMPPPVMGGGGGGPYSRPPPSNDMWKSGAPTTALQHMQQQQQSGRSFGAGATMGGGGGQYGGANNSGRMMHNQPHHNQGMHGGGPPLPLQHMQHSQQHQPFGGSAAAVGGGGGGGGDMWMQQQQGGGGHFGGAPMGRAMNMGGRADNNSMWRN